MWLCGPFLYVYVQGTSNKNATILSYDENSDPKLTYCLDRIHACLSGLLVDLHWFFNFQLCPRMT